MKLKSLPLPRLSHLAAAAAALVAAACATAPAPQRADAMVAAADPRAAAAGAMMLERGGSAADAAIATMAVLGLVEPQSAGIGGGAFALHYDSAERRIVAYDGREEAPSGATPELFLNDTGQPLGYGDAIRSGRSTGTPSLIAMLALLHADEGRLPWADLFEPAIDLAENGFVVSPRLANLIAAVAARGGLRDDPAALAYFFDTDGAPVQAGTVLRNPAYAETLRAIQTRGPDALRDGPIAEAIITTVRRDPRPGTLSLADLQAYAPRRLDPVCGEYRVYLVCGMGPPSSGGVAVAAILGLYERSRPEPVGPTAPEDWAAFVWASRIGYADRDHYLADDRFVPVPTRELIDPAYLDARAAEIALDAAAPANLAPGDPGAVLGGRAWRELWGTDATAEPGGTTHMSIVDFEGDAVAMTATVESVFGSQRMAAGFFLNNQLTDFSLVPTRGGRPVANAPAPGKRPRSSMSPTIILNPDGTLYAAVGSPGGSSIIAYVARTVIGVVDWDLSMQAAIDQPNVVARGPAVRVESARAPEGMMDALAARGWTIAPSAGEISGLHGVRVTPDGALDGGADPRREGVALRVIRP